MLLSSGTIYEEKKDEKKSTYTRILGVHTTTKRRMPDGSAIPKRVKYYRQFERLLSLSEAYDWLG